MDYRNPISHRRQSSKNSTPRTSTRNKTNQSPSQTSTKPSSREAGRGRHRTTQSYSGQPGSLLGATENIGRLLRDDLRKPEAKRKGDTPKRSRNTYRNNASRLNTPKTRPLGERRIESHRRTGSMIEKTSEAISEPFHRRNYSLDKQNAINAVSKFAHRTRTGFIPGNPNKTNQDSFIELTNFAGVSNMFLFGVLDGHGFYGREASSFCAQRVATLLASDPNLRNDPKKALTVSTIKTNAELAQVPFDVNFSGTTMILVYVNGTKLWCANSGDSRALMARQLPDPKSSSMNSTNSGRHWMSIALSRDHKPDEKDESARISHCGGRIEAYQDEEGNPMGPARVWLMDQDIPGLAMSRSLGDRVAASVGVICDPEILEFTMTPEDKFMVLGSDGIFEFISNEEIVKIVVPYWRMQDIQGACDALAKEAHSRWTMVNFIQEEEVIDDITCVVVFLDIPQ